LIKLYSHKASQQYISKVDISGDVFEYAGEKDYGVYLGMNPIPVQLAKQVIEEIQFPLMWLKMPLFLLPFRLMVRQNTWTGLVYNGRAYPTHVIYGARREVPTKESIGSLIVHELGHSLCYRFVDPNFRDKKYTEKFLEYMKLRGVPDDWNDHMSTPWDKRPSELWAEDFRYLFGPDYAREEEFLHYRYVDPPGEEIRQFMLDLVPEEYRGMRNVVEVIGEEVEEVRKHTVCIDPGHGGEDRANRGPTGYVEADGVLDIALKLQEFLEHYSDKIEVITTRAKDKTVSLAERVCVANATNADIFVSIHTNASDALAAEGIETYHSVFADPGEGGHKLAVCIQEELCRAANRKTRGIRSRKGKDGRDYYYVIKHTKMPAVIAECGFHTNPTEEHLLKTDGFRHLCAQGIGRGILRYFGIPEKTVEPEPEPEPEPQKVDVKDEMRKQLTIAKMAIEKVEKMMREV